MSVLTERRHAAEFLLSEANGHRSRENGTVASGQNLEAGTVVMLSSGKLVAYDAAPESTAVGIVLYPVNASGGDVRASYIARDAEVSKWIISYPADKLAETTASLADLGIIVR